MVRLPNYKVNCSPNRPIYIWCGYSSAILYIIQNWSRNITIDVNIKTTDYLDVTYSKPNNIPLYVHKESNHPPSILKNIPESINRRLCDISTNETIFNNAIPQYQEALAKSGYDYQLKYRDYSNNTNTSIKPI